MGADLGGRDRVGQSGNVDTGAIGLTGFGAV